MTVLLVNVLVFICIGSVYNASEQSYSQKLFQENIHNVENLNVASANAAYTYTNGMGVKIDDAVSFIEANGLNYHEAVQYLSEANTNPDRQFQIIKSGTYGDTGKLSFGDYSGISIRKIRQSDGSLETVSRAIKYGSAYYDIFKSFTDVNDHNSHGVCFAPEFTDPDTKLKCFAVYRHTVMKDPTGQDTLYTVMLAVNSQTALNAYNVQNKYAGQSTVLVNEDGDYIIKNSEYRNVNFFDYIVNYNGLTLDWRQQIQREIKTATENGSSPQNLFYKNHQGEDCAFSVTAITNGWYSITCVPLSSLDLEEHTVNYSLEILLLFLLLFFIDGITIYFIGKVLSYNVSVAEQATQEAMEANQAKSRFLSTMSHELRTPLNAIIGLAALSKDSINDPPVLKDYLKKIDISSKLLLQLISDILDVSAIESNKMKLNNSAFEITKLIAPLSVIYYDQCAAKGIEFKVELKDLHSELLMGDSVRVNQILLNFLSNAVKFTPSGGRVTLSVEQIQREDDVVVIRFCVKDNGCGVSEEMKTRLFHPFERETGEAAKKYGGSGLGLSIAKNLSELMNGHVGVESQEGVGSCFWAELPFGIPEKAARRSYSPIENLRVLVVVNDVQERDYIGQVLNGFGVTYSLAKDTEEALTLLGDHRQDKEPFDLCMLDWKLPDYNALDAMEKIRAALQEEAPRIMILTYNIAEVKARSAGTSADMVFGKPVFPSTLYNTLIEITTGQTETPPVPAQEFDLSGKRVLLVEDNQMNVEIAKRQLEKIGLTVETAENGQVGCERFIKSSPGYYDLILMDVQMPVMDGYQATAVIRKSAHAQANTIPILAMTANAFSEDVEKAKEAGMNEHLSKPVVPENLYAILYKYLG